MVRSWLEVLLWFPVAGVVRSLLGMWCLHWVLLPVVRRCTLALRQGRTNRWPWWDEGSVRDRVPASWWWSMVGC